MLRRLTFPFVLVFAGFIAGLVVTGRMRSASDSRAEPNAAALTTAAPPEQRNPFRASRA